MLLLLGRVPGLTAQPTSPSPPLPAYLPGCRMGAVPPALVQGCSRLELLDLTSQSPPALAGASRDLRRLLAANPGLRWVALSGAAAEWGC